MKELLMRENGYFCLNCKSVVYPYEQGITCNCDNPWEMMRQYEEDYPESWIECEILVTKDTEE